MKVTFIGGGGLKTLGLIRELLRVEGLLCGGEIALYDIAPERAKTIAALARQSPEYLANPATISVYEELDDSLAGADYVYFCICPWNQRQMHEAALACHDLNLLASDNLSLSGSFMATLGVPAVLKVARVMERFCPAAWIIIFTNPIAILTSAVLQGTKIHALGICGGQGNHFYDLARMMGWEEPNFGFEADVAGVNHLSWILNCRYNGENFFPLLDQRIEDGIDYARFETHFLRDHLRRVLPQMVETRNMFGGILFSTEGDGLPHVCYYDELLERQRDHYTRHREIDYAQRTRENAALWEKMHALVQQALPPDFWDGEEGWKKIAAPALATGIRVMHGLSGKTTERLAASTFNRGAVAGWPDDIVAEYSMFLHDDTVTPTGSYRLPAGLDTVLRALADHQHYIAQGIVHEDRDIFLQGMYAYPNLRSKRVADELMTRLVAIDDGPTYLK
ncbi:MAG: family 4 glycosyl hydrolase [Armatimonadota bacterium]